MSAERKKEMELEMVQKAKIKFLKDKGTIEEKLPDGFFDFVILRK
jgi:hypothetical protein